MMPCVIDEGADVARFIRNIKTSTFIIFPVFPLHFQLPFFPNQISWIPDSTLVVRRSIRSVRKLSKRLTIPSAWCVRTQEGEMSFLARVAMFAPVQSVLRG